MSTTGSGLSALSLFSGAGGLDMGVVATGVEIQLAIEMDADASASHADNVRSRRVLKGDVLDFEPLDLPVDSTKLDLILGGPPCTPFSKAGMWLEWKREGRDPHADLVSVFGRYVELLRPRAFILENVPGLASPRSPYRQAYELVLRRLTGAGYLLDAAVLNAAHFGVPQARQRLFLVGVRDGGQPSLPISTIKASVSAGEALQGLTPIPEAEEIVSGKWAHLIPLVPPGGNYLHFTKERGYPDPIFEWRSRYWSFLLKLHPDAPSPTIQAQPGPATGPFHWENRRLRVPELKRLFGFPDEAVFRGSRASVQRQIGDSVPPPLAKAVAESVIEAM